MVKLKRDGDGYVYKNYSVERRGDRWYVWVLYHPFDYTDHLIADFATLREVRDWLYKQEEE